ncbi:MAG: phosphatase PAP2 family protein [Polyangiaceae bacterium]
MSGGARTVAIATLASALLGASSVAADPSIRQAPDWAFGSPVGEAGVLGLASASLLFWFLPQRYNTRWKPLGVVPRAHLGSASDLTGSIIGVTLQAANGYAFEAAYLDDRRVEDPYQRALRAPLIDGEATLLTTGVFTAIKRISGRCRPRAFIDGRCLQTRSAHEGFPSGHTGPIAAIAATHLALALRTEHGPVEYRYAPFVFAELGAVGTAVLRQISGAHDWSDVIVGWAVGHAIGLVVSFAHPMEEVTVRDDATGASTAASVRARSRVITWSGRF